MIYLIYSAPCEYNPSQRGLAEAKIGHDGSDPVKAAEKYLRQIPGAVLCAVSLNGLPILNRL